MKKTNKYSRRARQLLRCGFVVVGSGYFDITIEELAVILEFIEQDNFIGIKRLYETLEMERL